MSDDEIVDAEIVDDDAPTTGWGVVEYRGVKPNLQPAEVERMRVDLQGQWPEVQARPDVVQVPLNFQQRGIIREALAHYFDKGPRTRNNRLALETMEHLADYEPAARCSTCDNTGRIRTMYGVDYCGCAKGLDARADGKSNRDLY